MRPGAIEAIASQDELPAPRSAEENRIPRDLPPYLADLYRTPLLTPSRERALFLKFNFHKMQFVQARRKLDPQFARLRDLNVMEAHLAPRGGHEERHRPREPAAGRQHSPASTCGPGLSLMELISDGNLTLMRAVEGFDVHAGTGSAHTRRWP
jgi:hypothetical protein